VAFHGLFLSYWVGVAVGLCCLQMRIAINEREHWTPRVARTIPRRGWLRPAAFLVYSGSAGGVLLALLLFGLTWAAVQTWRLLFPPPPGPLPWLPLDYLGSAMNVSGILFLYTYDYALTAVLLRRLFAGRIRIVETWVLMIFLEAICTAVPLLLCFTVHGRFTTLREQYPWFLPIPLAAAIAVANLGSTGIDRVFLMFAGGWAAVVTLLSLPWFWRQVVRFRPYVSGAELPVPVVAGVDDTTKTALT
jgi:hypothetical protein